MIKKYYNYYQVQIFMVKQYCIIAHFLQILIWLKPYFFYSTDYRPLEGAEDEQPDWMNNVGKPVPDFLSKANEDCLYAQIPEEMIIQLSEPEMKSLDENNQNMHDHIYYLSNTQQDELMRRYILQERSFTPDAKCSECTNRSCKACQILQNHKS